MTTPLPPRHRCPWFLSGLALGICLGLACISHGMHAAQQARPAFPVSAP